MLYITIESKKCYINKIIVEKHKLKPGMSMPFTGYKIFEDNKNEEEITAGNQEAYQMPENDNPESI